jgi:hypothetical protein
LPAAKRGEPGPSVRPPVPLLGGRTPHHSPRKPSVGPTRRARRRRIWTAPPRSPAQRLASAASPNCDSASASCAPAHCRRRRAVPAAAASPESLQVPRLRPRPVPRPLDHGEKQLFLGSEVVVDRALRVAGGKRDRVDDSRADLDRVRCKSTDSTPVAPLFTHRFLQRFCAGAAGGRARKRVLAGRRRRGRLSSQARSEYELEELSLRFGFRLRGARKWRSRC